MGFVFISIIKSGESTMLKYETEKVMAEIFYPHYKEINDEVWEHFENNDELLLSHITAIVSKLKINKKTFLSYLRLLTDGDSENPALLELVFYKVNPSGELEFINSPLPDVLSKVHAKEDPDEIEAIIDELGKTIFPVCKVIDEPTKPLLSSSFNLSSNSLSMIMKEW